MNEDRFEVGDILEEIAPEIIQQPEEYEIFEEDRGVNITQVEILSVLSDGNYEWRYFDWRYSAAKNEILFGSDYYAPFNFQGWQKVPKQVMSVDLMTVDKEVFEEAINQLDTTTSGGEFSDSQFFYNEEKNLDHGIIARIDYTDDGPQYFLDEYIVPVPPDAKEVDIN